MKQYLIFAIGALLVATGANAVITGSAHDFSGQGWGTTEICQPCHTPHNADTTVSDAPLWNHEVTAASYTLYSSPTLNATPAQPAGVSKLCLSCHDGTVALDSFGGVTGPPPPGIANPFGTDLTNDHPIAFAYTTALATADGELVDPSSAGSWDGTSTIQDAVLFADSLECASCHDVHNTAVPAGVGSLLLKDNDGSALCLTCHAK